MFMKRVSHTIGKKGCDICGRTGYNQITAGM